MWSSFRFAAAATPWNSRLNSRRNTFPVSLARKDRITTPGYYRVAFNARRQTRLAFEAVRHRDGPVGMEEMAKQMSARNEQICWTAAHGSRIRRVSDGFPTSSTHVFDKTKMFRKSTSRTGELVTAGESSNCRGIGMNPLSGNARSSVESSDSLVTHSTTPFSAWQFRA